jgi:hypothetical protein
MRRLAIFVAAAVIFAPGASLGGDSPQPSASVVAARMLAPTFDESEIAAFQAAAFAKKAQGTSERFWHAPLAIAAVAGAFSFANCRFTGVLSGRALRQIRRVVSSHRDRGPPHLQLA